jgi:hypothetical protein
MTSKTLEKIWQTYPESHLHCDVTMAGINTYCIIASLLSREGDVVATVEHYGSGYLDYLKEQAFNQLATEVLKLAEV